MLHVLRFQVARASRPETPDWNTRKGGVYTSLFQDGRAASQRAEKRAPDYQMTRWALLTFQPLPVGVGQKAPFASRE